MKKIFLLFALTLISVSVYCQDVAVVPNMEGIIVDTDNLIEILQPIAVPSLQSSIVITQNEVVRQLPRRKEPALALLFSILLPGGGQYYNGDVRRGIVMTSIFTGCVVGTILLHPNNSNDSTGLPFLLIGMPLATTAVIMWAWSMINAPVRANAINKANRALSWDMGSGKTLSLSPDLKMSNFSNGGHGYSAPVYGMKLSLNIH